MIRTSRILAAGFTVISLVIGISPAYSWDAGDILIRGRLINVNPDNDSSGVKTGGVEVVPGPSVEVDDAYTLDIDFTYMYTKNFGVELLLDLSSKHDIATTGALKGVADGDVIETRVLPPSLIAQYHFAPNQKIQPYAGVGINYTTFFDESATSLFKSTLGASSVHIDDSWGLVGQFGADFDMGNGWFFNLDAKYIDIDTTVHFKSTVLGGKAKLDSDIDPWVLGVGFGRKF